MEPFIEKFKKIFLEESSELLDQLEKNILELEQDSGNMELIEPVFRAMHTLKGTAGMYGFHKISEFTHGLENLYQGIRDKKFSFNKTVFDISLNSVDLIRLMLADEQLEIPENISRFSNLTAALQLILRTANLNGPLAQTKVKDAVKTFFTWQIILSVSEQLYFRGINFTGLFTDLASLGTYKVNRSPVVEDSKIDKWEIILYTSASEAEIREVFIFLEDDCKFIRLSGSNLLEAGYNAINAEEQSISNYIEQLNNDAILESKTGKETKNPSGIRKQNGTETLHKRITVDSAKLDHLMYLVSELITLNSQFSLSTSGEKFDLIRPMTERLDYLSKQFRGNALDIRLVPLSETVFRFKRLIRDLSKQLDKEVDLLTEGIDTEVDKGTLDQLNDPMMHIIRNCIDHGLEEPELRVRKGKPAKGIIKISASKSGNNIFIRIEDDGTGIDLEKIRQKAIEKGLLKKSDNPSGQELMDMIFLPGFSMARNLTEISGRGVGMDIVKSRIAELRGEITIETEISKGTAFILKLQQSISIIDSLLFKVSDTFFTLPITDIESCMEVSSEMVLNRKSTGTMVIGDEMIPFLDLKSKFHIDYNYGKFLKAIIVICEGKKLAVLTDFIIGSHQAVVKPLGNLFRQNRSIGAASLLGDGRLAFMLETKELF